MTMLVLHHIEDLFSLIGGRDDMWGLLYVSNPDLECQSFCFSLCPKQVFRLSLCQLSVQLGECPYTDKTMIEPNKRMKSEPL